MQEIEIIDHVNISIDKIGIEATRLKTIDMLNQSLELKRDLESRKVSLKNVPQHIEMALDILKYLDLKKQERRNSRISSLFENQIMNFNTYCFKILLEKFI